MNCPGKYKYKNTRANKIEILECGKETKCKHYKLRTSGREIPMSRTGECEHYLNPFKTKSNDILV